MEPDDETPIQYVKEHHSSVWHIESASRGRMLCGQVISGAPYVAHALDGWETVCGHCREFAPIGCLHFQHTIEGEPLTDGTYRTAPGADLHGGPGPVPYVPAEVDHPRHYGGDTVYEVIKVLEAWGVLDFCLGNAIKYIARAGKKSEKILEDLKKARWYLDRRIAQLDVSNEKVDP